MNDFTVLSNLSWTLTRQKYAVSVYNFSILDEKHPLFDFFISLFVGDELILIEECLGWYRGYKLRIPSKVGIFPSSFVHIIDGTLIDGGTEDATIVLNEDPVIHEIAESLRYLDLVSKRLYLDGDYTQYDLCYKIMNSLIVKRRNLMKPDLPFTQKKILKDDVIKEMEFGNKQLGIQLLPRDSDGRSFDIPCHGFSDLYYSMHSKFGVQNDNLNNIEIGITSGNEQTISGHFHHLFFSLRAVVFQMLFDTEMFVSLYNASTGSRICEQYRICMDQKGVPKDPSKLLKTYAVFTDLESTDISQDLYLMIEMVRFGPFETKEAQMVGTSIPFQGGGATHGPKVGDKTTRRLQVFVRRPYAVGLYSLNGIFQDEGLKSDEEVDLLVAMYQCHAVKDAEFHNLPQHILSKNENIVAPLGPKGAGGVFINLKALNGTFEEVQASNSYLFTNQTSVCNRLFFPEIILPEMKRNDFYIRLKSGIFPKYTKKADKNVEIEVIVRRKDGSVIEDCIYPGNGEAPLTYYYSTVFYHNARPFWNDVVKLSLTPDEFYGSHVEFLFRHRSNNFKDEKPYSLSFVRLIRENGTLIADGDHDLMVYKASNLLCKEGELPKYMRNEFKDLKPIATLTRDELKVVKDLIANRETFIIETIGCSTTLTKNVNILNLLLWQNHVKSLPSVLSSVKDIPDEDMVLFLDELLHAIFRILNEGQPAHHSYALSALIHILSLLSLEKKYFHFKKYLDQYCQKQFYSAMAYKAMLQQSSHLIKKLINGNDFEDYELIMIRKFFKAISYFLKFVIKSRELHSQAGGAENKEEFEGQILGLLDLFVALLSLDGKDNILLPVIQAMAIQNLPYCFPDLSQILPPVQLSLRLSSLMSVGKEDKLVRLRYFSCSSLSDFKLGLNAWFDKYISSLMKNPFIWLKIYDGKLIFILHALRSSIMSSKEARKVLLPEIIKQLIKFIKNPQIVSISSGAQAGNNFHYAILCLFSLFSLLYGKGDVDSEIQLLSRDLLPIIATTLTSEINKHEPKIFSHLISGFIGLLDCINETQFSTFMSAENFPKAVDLELFLSKMFEVILYLIDLEIYPDDWMIVKLRKDFIISRTIISISDALDLEVLCVNEENDINFDLWLSFFQLASKFCTQKELQIDLLSDFSRRKILERYGDMRVVIAELLVTKWRHLYRFHSQFTFCILHELLIVSLLPPASLQRIVIPVFFDMIVSTHSDPILFSKLESEFIEKFDTLISGQDMGDNRYVEAFNSTLFKLCQSDSRVQYVGIKLINQLNDLLVRLLDFKDVERKFEASDIKMKAMFNLLNYYKEKGRNEMYIRYIYRFCQMLEDRSFYTEAGFTLLLHADVLDWSKSLMISQGKFPSQSEIERKESLYLEIIDNFDKGKMWELSIEQAKKLVHHYEKSSFEYEKLSRAYEQIGSFFSKILKEVRPNPEYFRVAFYGRGFPKFIQNTQFIYRGLDFENLQSFNDRLSNEFPDAKIMKTLSYPKNDVLESPDQYLQSCKVDPIQEMENFDEGVDQKIQGYFNFNDVCRFKYSRPFHKGGKDKTNEFKTLWLERTTYTTNIKFPGLLKSFPVIATEIKDISPIEYAQETVKLATQELKSLINSIKSGQTINVNPLSMRLNGIIEAAVMGGLTNYEDAFFCEDYIINNRDDVALVNELKELIREQIEVCEKGIKIHGDLCEEALYPFHERLKSQFALLKDKYYTGYQKFSNEFADIESPSDSGVIDLDEKMSRQRINSYSAKRSASSKGTSIGKQLTIIGKVNPKTSVSSKSVSSIVEEDSSSKSSEKPLKPSTPRNVRESLHSFLDDDSYKYFEDSNNNNSTSNC